MQSGDLKAEIQHKEHKRPRHRGDKAVKRSSGPHSGTQHHHSAKRVSEPQLALSLRQWRLRRAQKHRRTENKRLVRRVLSALQRCDVSIDDWVDALMVRRVARSVKPIGGHRRGRGQSWSGSSSSSSNATAMAWLPCGDRAHGQPYAGGPAQGALPANTAARHPQRPAPRRAAVHGVAGARGGGVGAAVEPLHRRQLVGGRLQVVQHGQLLGAPPEEMERFVYLLLRKAHDDEHGGGEGNNGKKLLSASTLVQPHR